MTGLIAILVLGVLLVLASWAFVWTYKARRRQGKSDMQSFAWAVGALVVLSLPITWDAIPTWISFKYYSDRVAGITVFKTLGQWKAENPGVAETLAPFGPGDQRSDSRKVAPDKARKHLNERLAFDTTSREALFLSVHATTYEVVDTKPGEVLVRYVEVASGNGGGLASGGPGWWAFWLVHRSSGTWFNEFFRLVESAKNVGVKLG